MATSTNGAAHARALWDAVPAGATHAPEDRPGTEAFFRKARARRLEQELPWLPEVVPFESFRGLDVLEVGCGAGFDAHAICSAGARYVGIDLADANPGRTRAHLAFEGLTPRVLQADAERLPFPDATFDVVYSNGVLHHVADIDRAMGEVRRVLRPGGRLFAILYHRDSVFHWSYVVARDHLWRCGCLVETYDERLGRVEHGGAWGLRPPVRVFSRRGARRLVERAGLAVQGTAVRKLTPEDAPASIGRFLAGVPPAALRALGRVAGWYVIVEARRPATTVRLVHGVAPAPGTRPGEDVVGLRTVRDWITSGAFIRRLGRYDEGVVATARLEVQPRPLASALALWPFARALRFEDARGGARPVRARDLAHLAAEAARDALRWPLARRRVRLELEELECTPRPAGGSLRRHGRPVYLRTNLDFDLRAGGSVGHVAGVLNNLDAFLGPPIFLTTDRMPTARADIETVDLPLPALDREFPGRRGLDLNLALEGPVRRAVAGRSPALVYHRSDNFSYLGLKAARSLGVPFILEYNGSELWAERHWGGRRVPHQALAERIEDLNLRAADLVVVVSDVLREELVGRGVEPRRVLVNPNGVDPARYAPTVDGAAVRARLGLGDRLVVGFIGTFGPWHGAERLVEAWARLLATAPDLRSRARLLMVGAGARLEATKELAARSGVAGACVFTGLVPQVEGPAHLAACDVLVASHVPNPDGSRFFGSPTKLFEYMAMGKGIVASRLEQLGDVLEDGRTALLVPPDDPEALAAGIRRLVDDPDLRARLGRAARAEVEARHSWRAHTGRIVEALERVLA